MSTEPPAKDSVFDRLVGLADTDPEAFQQVKLEILEEFILSCPADKQMKMRQIQWRLDAELNLIKNPVERYNKMVELFWAQFAKFKKAVDELNTACKDLQQTLDGTQNPSIHQPDVVIEKKPKAQVLAFERKC